MTVDNEKIAIEYNRNKLAISYNDIDFVNKNSVDNNISIHVDMDVNNYKIKKHDIIFNYLRAKDLGLNYDIRKDIYNNVDKLTFADLQKFHKNELSGKPFTYAIVASDKVNCVNAPGIRSIELVCQNRAVIELKISLACDFVAFIADIPCARGVFYA